PRKLRLRQHSSQRRLHLLLARLIKTPPAPERTQQTGGRLRIELVELDDAVREEGVAAAVLGMEPERIAACKRAHEGAHLVGIADRERLVIQQLLYPLQCLGERRGGLEREPFVDDQRVRL